MWPETICHATPPLPFSLSIWSSMHSRTSRAHTPAGSNDCTTFKRRCHVFRRMPTHGGDLFERSGKVAVLVQVADHGLGRVPDGVRDQADA